MAADGLVVTVTNEAGYTKGFDFAELPVARPMQEALAASFAARSLGWTSHSTARTCWTGLEMFAKFVAGLDSPPDDLDGLTVTALQSWRDLHIRTNSGKTTLRVVRGLLQGDARLAGGPVAEELARRIPKPVPSKQSYGDSERDRVVLTAQRQFRSAWLRITENSRLLSKWRAGDLAEGSREWKLGRVLEHVARTGDVPRTVMPGGLRHVTHRRLLGSASPEKTWGRLFLTHMELTALAVLLTDRFAWNLSVYDRIPAPRTSPSVGETTSVTYQIQVEKHRAGRGRWFSTENVTDSGADSPGRLISQAMQATAHARTLANDLQPGVNLFMAARAYQIEPKHTDLDRPAPVGPVSFGVSYSMAQYWANKNGLGGSPFGRVRRTTVTDRQRPLQHSQGTHESVYVLPDKRVQRASRDVFEAGAVEALGQARAVVFGGTITAEPDPEHQETATADCEDEESSPWPAPEGGCGADFLLCLACSNAHVHPGHHPRLAHLHQQILGLRSAMDDRMFRARWNDHLLRLEDLRDDDKKIGLAAWKAALARVSDSDRSVVQLLLKGDLAP